MPPDGFHRRGRASEAQRLRCGVPVVPVPGPRSCLPGPLAAGPALGGPPHPGHRRPSAAWPSAPTATSTSPRWRTRRSSAGCSWSSSSTSSTGSSASSMPGAWRATRASARRARGSSPWPASWPSSSCCSASHVAVAQPIFLANDVIEDITGNAGDDTEIADLEALASANADFTSSTSRSSRSSPPSTRTPRLGSCRPRAEPSQARRHRGGPAEQRGHAERQGLGRQEAPEHPARGRRWRASGGVQLPDGHDDRGQHRPGHRPRGLHLPAARHDRASRCPRSWPAARALGGKYNNKINTLYTVARGRPDLFPGNDRERGFEALMGALGTLYGLDIDYYVAVDLNSFRNVVNTLGGVVVDVQLPVYDPEYPADDGRGKLKLYIPPGMVKMNGQQALAYARSRHTTSDFDRSARQQRVITSVRDQTDLARPPRAGRPRPSSSRRSARTSRRTSRPSCCPGSCRWPRRSTSTAARTSCSPTAPASSTVCYPCGPQGLWVLKADVATHPLRRPERLLHATGSRPAPSTSSRRRAPSSTSSTATAART